MSLERQPRQLVHHEPAKISIVAIKLGDLQAIDPAFLPADGPA